MEIKFGQKDIENMRALRKEGHSIYKIANAFGVPSNLVWQYTADIKPEKNQRMERTHLNAQQKSILMNLYSQGLAVDQIARFLGVTDITVSNNVRKLKAEA